MSRSNKGAFYDLAKKTQMASIDAYGGKANLEDIDVLLRAFVKAVLVEASSGADRLNIPGIGSFLFSKTKPRKSYNFKDKETRVTAGGTPTVKFKASSYLLDALEGDLDFKKGSKTRLTLGAAHKASILAMDFDDFSEVDEPVSKKAPKSMLPEGLDTTELTQVVDAPEDLYEVLTDE